MPGLTTELLMDLDSAPYSRILRSDRDVPYTYYEKLAELRVVYAHNDLALAELSLKDPQDPIGALRRRWIVVVQTSDLSWEDRSAGEDISADYQQSIRENLLSRFPVLESWTDAEISFLIESGTIPEGK